MVEFAAVLLPVLLIVVGIVQFGLLFGANVTLTNAAREAATGGDDHPVRRRLHSGDERCHALHRGARCRASIVRDPGGGLTALRGVRSLPRRERPERRRLSRPLGERRHDRDPVRLDGNADEPVPDDRNVLCDRRPGRVPRPGPADVPIRHRRAAHGRTSAARRERALRPAGDRRRWWSTDGPRRAARADARHVRGPHRHPPRLRGGRDRRRAGGRRTPARAARGGCGRTRGLPGTHCGRDRYSRRNGRPTGHPHEPPALAGRRVGHDRLAARATRISMAVARSTRTSSSAGSSWAARRSGWPSTRPST